MHPHPSRAFQRYQECSMKRHSLRDLGMTNKTNHLASYIEVLKITIIFLWLKPSMEIKSILPRFSQWGIFNVVILSKLQDFGTLVLCLLIVVPICIRESIFVFDVVLSIYLTKTYGFMYNYEQWKSTQI